MKLDPMRVGVHPFWFRMGGGIGTRSLGHMSPCTVPTIDN
jgi:hypothetical protein